MGNLDRITFTAFLACVLFGGLNAVGVRFTVLELRAFWGAVLRFAPASLLLFAVVFARRVPLPKSSSLVGALLYGALNGISYCFLYWGLQRAQPGLASIILSLSPLMTLLIAVTYRQEALRWPALAGSLLAVGGVAVVFGDQVSASLPFPYLLALILGAACLSWAAVVIKNYPMADPISTNAVAMAAASAVLMIMSLLFNEPRPLPAQVETWLALAYLILFGSAILFILILVVLHRWTASATAYITVLFPFITISASALLGEDQITPALILGAALVMSGVYIGAIRPASRRIAARHTGQEA